MILFCFWRWPAFAKDFFSFPQKSDYYLLLVVQVGSDKITKRSPKVIKRDFRALEQWVEGSRAQEAISLSLPVTRNNIYWNREIH